MTTTTMPKVLSYGGGLDSFAMLVDAIQRGELPDQVVFINVGDPAGEDPGEWPSTYKHMREVAVPLCTQHGIEFIELNADNGYPVRDARSFFAWMQARTNVPVAGPRRTCTIIAKVERFEKWMVNTHGTQPVEVWIGFEANEAKRAASDPNAGVESAQRRNRFPLIERGLCRCRCEALVRAAGYPVPRKSACVFCPYGSRKDWQTLARELPETFAKVEELERAKMDNPTRNGFRLSIMGYRTTKAGTDRNRRKNAGEQVEAPELGTHYKAPTLREFVDNPGKGTKAKGCETCGRTVRATKASGCSYLGDDESVTSEDD